MAEQTPPRTGVPADHPILAFVNSVADDGKTRSQSMFATGQELCDLLPGTGLPVPAAAELAGLTALREALFDVLSACAAGRDGSPEAVAMVERAIREAVSRAGIGMRPGGLVLRAAPGGVLADHLALWAFDLMSSADFPRLSECRRCTRLFLDRGRGRGRRWCDMARCGNRAKAESFRARRQAAVR